MNSFPIIIINLKGEGWGNLNSSLWPLWLTILLLRGWWCSGQTRVTVIYASINLKLQHPPRASPGIWTFKDWFVYIIFAIIAERNDFFLVSVRYLLKQFFTLMTMKVVNIYLAASAHRKKATTIHLPFWWITFNILQSSAAFRVNYCWPTEKPNLTYKNWWTKQHIDRFA